MSAYDRLMDKKSRRGLIVSIAGLLGSGGFLGSKLLHLLTKSEGEQGILVRISFHSMKYPNKKYTAIEDFWQDHPALLAASNSSLNVLKDVAGQRLAARILPSGHPAYEVYYPSLKAYFDHSHYLTQAYGVLSERLSDSCFKYTSQDFFAVDEIKKIS